ncbi:MAG TPA: DPP IV N-terminal domain-containing protein [Longimicrobiales bacterium]
MTRTYLRRLPALLPALLLLPLAAHAQGTLADYERALSLPDRLDGLVVGVPEAPHWIEGTDRFWYRKSVEGGDAFVLVDAAAREKRPAFDHERLAASLSAAAEESYTAVTLPFRTFDYVDDGRAIEFRTRGGQWRCDLESYACERTRSGTRFDARGEDDFCGWLTRDRGGDDRPRVSPDGKLEAFIRDHNLFVRAVGSEEARQLSFEGAPGDEYVLRSIAWSPDSRKIAAYRVDPAPQRMVYYIESSPDDQLQPKLHSCPYTKPGDELDVQQPVLFDVETGEQIIVDNTLFPNAYNMTRLEWRKDGRAFTFEYNQRGHQVYRVIEVDAETGAARAIISEEPETFFDYSGKKYRYDVDDGREIIWMSERDGWNHLYLIDGETGRVKNQITKGEWVVRGVDYVDEEKRQIWFRAGGMNPDQDPYFVHAYRINFDGTGLVALTEANGNHRVTYSPDMKYYVDTWSRVDLPPISQLRRASDGEVLLELERADASALYATGWRPPEVFVAKGRDGKTDIWGIIVRPMNFDPSKKYPVIESIYAGPHGSFVPKSFSTLTSFQAQAELGFIVVQIDGMGTSNRSKAFHDVAWKNLKDAGFPDRILWHKAVAEKYPWYDITRVGIYGTSAGGQNALGALLFHGDFYDAAVSAAGCHDNRMDKIWWNEQWMGWPLGPQYAASSNVENAYRLQGDLLLVVGELDRNVDPSSTFQVVDALIKANKTFDLLFLPGRDHTSGGEYGQLKRFDFFVHHLLGVEPPAWNSGVLAAEIAS